MAASSVPCRPIPSRVWVATRVCPLTATGDCPLMANSPRFVVAFRAGKEPFGQHDFAGSRPGRRRPDHWQIALGVSGRADARPCLDVSSRGLGPETRSPRDRGGRETGAPTPSTSSTAPPRSPPLRSRPSCSTTDFGATPAAPPGPTAGRGSSSSMGRRLGRRANPSRRRRTAPFAVDNSRLRSGPCPSATNSSPARSRIRVLSSASTPGRSHR